MTEESISPDSGSADPKAINSSDNSQFVPVEHVEPENVENLKTDPTHPHQKHISEKNKYFRLALVFTLLAVLIISGIVIHSLDANRDQSATDESPAIDTTQSSDEMSSEGISYDNAKLLSSPVRIYIGGSSGAVVVPGVSNSFTITTGNTGDNDVTVEYEISGEPISWFDTQKVPESIKLKSGKEHKFDISFEVSGTSKTGDIQILTIKAIPIENPRMADSTQIELEVGPKAWFSCTVGENDRPLSVSCENITVGDADTWLWDFGDGTTSTQKHPPVHIYEDETRRTITLTATSENGSSIYSKDIWF